MITTLFLLQLIGFQLWYMTAKKGDKSLHPVFLKAVLDDTRKARISGGVLIVLATIVFIVKLGIMSGLAAAIVGLMAAGCLVLLLSPYKYFGSRSMIMLYALFLILEIVI